MKQLWSPIVFCHCLHKYGLQSSCLLHCSIRINWNDTRSTKHPQTLEPRLEACVLSLWLFWGWDVFHSVSLSHRHSLFMWLPPRTSMDSMGMGPQKWLYKQKREQLFSTPQRMCMGSICCGLQYNRVPGPSPALLQASLQAHLTFPF